MAVLDSFRVNGTDYDLRDSKAVRFNEAQNLTEAQKAQARENIGVTPGAVRYDAEQTLTDAQKQAARQNIGAADDSNSVHINDAQNLTEAQKAQARENIGAATGAVRYDTAQELTDEQKAIGRANIGAVAINQGIAHAGKVMIVGSDGNVTTGDVGISYKVKNALLNLLQHVAYTDDQSKSYYDNLYAALYDSDYPKLEVVYSPGTHVLYTDEALDTLKPYLTVKLLNSDQDSGTLVTNYSLSGTLNVGDNTIIVTYENLISSVIVSANDPYNTWNWSIANGLTIQHGAVDGDVNTDNGTWYNDKNSEASAQYNTRRMVCRTAGISDYLYRSNLEHTGFYPIPVPAGANKFTVSITPSTQFVNAQVWRFNGTKYTNGAGTGWQQGTATRNFTSRDDLFMIINTKYNSAGTSYPTEPTNITITFEEV